MKTATVFDTLLSLELINSDQHAHALECLHALDDASTTPSTPGDALPWLLDQGVLTFRDLAAMEQAQGFIHDLDRREARQDVLEACMDAMARDIPLEAEAAAGTPAPAAASPVPWLLVAGAVLAVGFIGWKLMGTPGTPTCADSEVLASLRSGAMQAARQARNPLQAMRDPAAAREETMALLQTRIVEPRQIANLEDAGMRVCVAALEHDGEREPFGYTISRHEDGGYVVQGGDAAWLQAKYATHPRSRAPEDALGAPLGGEAITAAFREAVAQLDRMSPSRRPRTQAASETEVLPLAPCTQDDPARLTCRLMFQHEDRLMQALGQDGQQVIEADFALVQDGTRWRMADDFVERYTHAIMRSRVARTLGEEAATAFGEGSGDEPAEGDAKPEEHALPASNDGR